LLFEVPTRAQADRLHLRAGGSNCCRGRTPLAACVLGTCDSVARAWVGDPVGPEHLIEALEALGIGVAVAWWRMAQDPPASRSIRELILSRCQ
jgi:hypothetical protein